MLDQRDPLGGVVRPGARDHGHATGRGLHHRLDDLTMLVMGKRRAFAGRADGDKAMRAFADMPVDEFLQSVPIHRAVLERRDQGNVGPFEHDTLL